MKILIDINVLYHREPDKIIFKDVEVLFDWLDKLRMEICINSYSFSTLTKQIQASGDMPIEKRIPDFTLLETAQAEIEAFRNKASQLGINNLDDLNVSLLIELYLKNIAILITEDRSIHSLAEKFSIADNVFTIDDYLEKVISENPELTSYNVLSVKKEHFRNIDLSDPFFNSLKENYVDFIKWYESKANKDAYVCYSGDDNILAFLYLKIEHPGEKYSDIKPEFELKKRLKVGTFKVLFNGHRIGERFMKIIFDNAIINEVDEIYLTIFNNNPEEAMLINYLTDWGFIQHGVKRSISGEELVFTRNFHPVFNSEDPKLSYPYYSRSQRKYIVPIRPEYHTNLLPDSILSTESAQLFMDNKPHQNAIRKSYVSRSYFRDLIPGDIIIFYRTGGYHLSVITTIGVVEKNFRNIASETQFISICKKSTVFSVDELKEQWNLNKTYKPFVVKFLYMYSFPNRLNMETLINLGIIESITEAPRGFELLTNEHFEVILRETMSDERYVID